jgi:hypothetical protein
MSLCNNEMVFFTMRNPYIDEQVENTRASRRKLTQNDVLADTLQHVAFTVSSGIHQNINL